MKNYDKKKKSSFLTFWDINNWYGWTLSQNVSVNDFKCVE